MKKLDHMKLTQKEKKVLYSILITKVADVELLLRIVDGNNKV